MVTYGDCSPVEGTIQGLMCHIYNILIYAVPLLIAVAVVVFLYGVVKYITAGGSEEKRAEARMTMIYGIIGLFVMVAIWGLVGILLNTFGIAPGGRMDYPQL